MAYFHVIQEVRNRGEMKEIFFVLETDHATLDDLHEELLDNGSIIGTRHTTRGTGLRRLRITESYDIILNEDSFKTISEMINELEDKDGSKLWTFANDNRPDPREVVA